MNKQVKYLMTLPQPVQLSPEWFQKRKFCLTASSLSVLLVKDSGTCDKYIEQFSLDDTFKNGKCANPYSQREEYINEKASGISKFKGNVATYHGQKYEQVASDIYERRSNKKMYEFGLLQHSSIDWLAASPDGIRHDGVMLEIKCPYRRKITGVVPFYYYIQVQIQLEVCDLEVCHFFECEFVEYVSMSEFIDDTTETCKIEEKGLFLQLQTMPDKFEKRVYIYPPLNILSVKDLIEWKEAEIKKLDEPLKTVCTIYWKLITVSNCEVKRDREWFAYVKPVLQAGHEEIMARKKIVSANRLHV